MGTYCKNHPARDKAHLLPPSPYVMIIVQCIKLFKFRESFKINGKNKEIKLNYLLDMTHKTKKIYQNKSKFKYFFPCDILFHFPHLMSKPFFIPLAKSMYHQCNLGFQNKRVATLLLYYVLYYIHIADIIGH